MIMKSLDWAHDNGAYGAVVWIAGATLACCTGLGLFIVLYDILKDLE